MKAFIVLSVALMATAISAGTISPSVKLGASKGLAQDIIVEFASIDDVFSSPALLSKKGDERANTMVSMLKARTQASQQPIVEFLTQKFGKSLLIEQFWLSNIISVKKATPAVIQALATLSTEFIVREPHTAHIIEPTESYPASNITTKQGLQYGVAIIGCEEAWRTTKGEGIVVGIIDTGVYQQHEALSGNFAGGWHDPYYNRPNPTDANSHGTHALGSAVGTANGIGVAPGARWIACRGLNDQGSGTEANLINCGQWMTTANPRPNVVSNSWGGGGGSTWYNSVVNGWSALDIVPVFALGNSGSSCRTALSPGDQPGLISVGATTAQDTMAGFSSRGPGPNNSLKPEVSAPGNSITSAGNTSPAQYTVKSGTSMATPHVAGAVALVLASHPGIKWTRVQEILQETTDKPTLSNADRGCGLPGSGDFPNHAFGHGRINVAKAVKA